MDLMILKLPHYKIEMSEFWGDRGIFFCEKEREKEITGPTHRSISQSLMTLRFDDLI